jgi:hypothetical protein
MSDRPNARIFLSHAGGDRFEASLLQFAVEHILAHLGATVWTYRRDQARDEHDIAGSLKARVRQSNAVIFLLSPSTLEMSGTQWMELAYADAFDKPVFILLHRLDFAGLAARSQGVPPLVLASQCSDAALDWRAVIDAVGQRLAAGVDAGG